MFNNSHGGESVPTFCPCRAMCIDSLECRHLRGTCCITGFQSNHGITLSAVCVSARRLSASTKDFRQSLPRQSPEHDGSNDALRNLLITLILRISKKACHHDLGFRHYKYQATIRQEIQSQQIQPMKSPAPLRCLYASLTLVCLSGCGQNPTAAGITDGGSSVLQRTPDPSRP